jgi:hypothetical protein
MSEQHDTEILLRRLGERLGASVSSLLAFAELQPEMKAQLGQLQDLGVRLQSLERVIGGHGHLAPERLDLGLAMVQLRAERAHALERMGATIEGPADGMDVRISAGVLKQALDLALDHMLSLGPQLAVQISTLGDPPLPTLQMTVGLPFVEAFAASPESLDELHWALLSLLCNRCGIRLERQIEAHRVVLRLGFVPAL